MVGELSPSIMCADLMNLQKEIHLFEKMNVEYVHVDFMDGKFVPNITFGTDIIKHFKKVMTQIKRDIHIMAYDPEQYFDKMDIGENDIVSVHYEACTNVRNTLNEIKNRGASPCLAISPDTPVEVIKEYLDIIDVVLVMTVYPGFAGQPLAPRSLERIKEVREIIDTSDYKNVKIEVDGNVSWENSVKMKEVGADIFVAGSSSIFDKKKDIENNINEFYQLINHKDICL